MLPFMLSKKERARVRTLRKAGGRAEAGQFLVTGVRAVDEILSAASHAHPGLAASALAITSPRLTSVPAGAALLARLGAVARVEEVTDKEMSALAPTPSHQGALLVCELPIAELPALVPNSKAPVLVLDGIQDPGNVGTLVRSAVAFGCSHVICLDGCADPFGPKAVRSAAGMVLRIPLVRADAEAFLGWQRDHSVELWIADAAGDGTRGEPGPNPPWCLVLGGEGDGVRRSVRERAARVVRVGMPGPAESLNVAMAGSILLYAFGSRRVHSGDKDNP